MGATRIGSWDDLKAYRGRIRDNAAASSGETVVAVGMATCGVAAGAAEVMSALADEIAANGVKGVKLVSTGCYGFCYAEPMVEVRVSGAPGVKYGYVDDARAREIVKRHLMKGELLENAILTQEVQKP